MKQKSINLIASYFVQWFDADYHAAGVLGKIRDIDRVNWIRCLPFVILHLGCLGHLCRRLELDCRLRRHRALYRQDVCHHWDLPSLFFPPYV